MTAPRIDGLDAVRGVAVLGILVMNIVAMGLPAYAYVNPFYAGYAGPADGLAWAIAYILFDGKMRALFTMLFGASMALIADRALARPAEGSPALIHYSRMFWLFVIGMVHAWLLWYGDILVQYAVAGALGFALWRCSRRWLVAVALVATAGQLGINVQRWQALATARTAATAPGATPAARQLWRDTLAAEVPGPEQRQRELDGYRGGVVAAFEARRPYTVVFQTFVLPLGLPEIFAFMAFGILLLRSGFFAGAWARRDYWRAVVAGYGLGVPLTALLAWRVWRAALDPVLLPLTDSASFVLRPFIALAHASVVMLLVTGGRRLARLSAAGRMALSNYIGTSVITTTLFYGYGLGLFGELRRVALYPVVLAVWALILLWSKPWLDRFHHGPLEWLWRSLARAQAQPFRRAPAR